MKKIKYIAKILIMAVCAVFICTFAEKSYIQAGITDSSVIRVGLEGIYHNTSAMNIRNTTICLGYCDNNTFVTEVTLSGGGFSFVPFNSSYAASGSYSTYVQAKDAAAKKGGNSVPMVTSKGSWSVATIGAGSADKYAVRITGGNTDIIYTIDSNRQYPQFMAVNEGVVDLGERQYRGRIEIGTYGGGSLRTVNIVELEEYLYSVVSCEMTASWHMEALKAQAVCARSYAVCSTGFGGATNIENPYYINDTTASQVYRGFGSEKENPVKAVCETKGQLIYYNGEVVKGFYSSTSGGSTENVEDVWGSPYGYLRQVSDIYELTPELEPWIIKFTSADIENLLAENNIDVGTITDIRPCIYTQSGRVYAMEVVGDKEKHTITGEKLRLYLSLYSTKYKVVKYGENPDYVAVVSKNETANRDIADCYIINGEQVKDRASQTIEQYVVITEDNLINYPRTAPKDKNTYYLAGMGYGHGIGLSQSGAKGMAENGFDYKQILKHYYTDVEIR